jgi:hypothetical protein
VKNRLETTVHAAGFGSQSAGVPRRYHPVPNHPKPAGFGWRGGATEQVSGGIPREDDIRECSEVRDDEGWAREGRFFEKNRPSRKNLIPHPASPK